MSQRRIVYIQYTNPAAYPPLEHSSRILADAGWRVDFLGTGSEGEADALTFQPHLNSHVFLWRFCPPGVLQKFHFIAFSLWVIWKVFQWRPKWVYASDLFSTPSALALSILCRPLRILYHEHDSPCFSEAPNGISMLERLLKFARERLARRVTLCVLPNDERAERLREQTRTHQPIHVVWNVPERSEAEPERDLTPSECLRLFYHGSIVPSRLPETLIDALAGVDFDVVLQVAGYQTIGHLDYVRRLKQKTVSLGIESRFVYLGPISKRADLLQLIRKADVGVALMPMTTDDFNEATMAGASNKPYDYLACGLALLVSRLPQWERLFSKTGYARTCDPTDVNSIATALTWFFENPEATRRMAEQGRNQILQEWNYEMQFAPVLSEIQRLSG